MQNLEKMLERMLSGMMAPMPVMDERARMTDRISSARRSEGRADWSPRRARSRAAEASLRAWKWRLLETTVSPWKSPSVSTALRSAA